MIEAAKADPEFTTLRYSLLREIRWAIRKKIIFYT